MLVYKAEFTSGKLELSFAASFFIVATLGEAVESGFAAMFERRRWIEE